MDLPNLVKQWSESFSASQYAGELVISEEDLPAIAEAIHIELFSPRRSIATERALLALAVNCMYYYHNKRGFWIHLNKLLKLPDNPQTKSWLGDMIENQLLYFGFIDQARVGPFRYVSPLREQTGITRHEIPRFAETLRNLSIRFGWPGIHALSRTNFNALITAQLQSGHLCQFLHDEPGWEFTIDVVRSISQYRRGVVSSDDLQSLPGYRSGFFEELFERLGKPSRERGMGVSRPPRPKLTYSPDFQQVMMLFNEEYVHEHRYEVLDERVSQTPMACSEDTFREILTGRLQDGKSQWHDWRISGWDPERRPIALFHTDRGLISDPHGLIPGLYYCLATPENAPPSDLQRCYYGFVDLPDSKLDYDAWLIAIDSSVDLVWAGFDFNKIVLRSGAISWGMNRGELEGVVDIETAFIGSVPSVNIHDPSSFASNLTALFVSTGNEPQRVPIGPSNNHITIDVPVPSHGKIWVEPISRRREFSGMDILDELSFAVLPEYELHWPDGLFSPNDTPSVRFLSQDGDVSLTLRDAINTNDEGVGWKIDPGIDVVQGQVECEGISLNVAKRVYRAGIRKTYENSTLFFSIDDFATSTDLMISGVSDSEVILNLYDGESYTEILALGKFSEAGSYRCTSMSLRDTIRHFRQPAGIFVVVYDGKPVDSGSVFTDVPKIKEFIETGDITNYPNWLNTLPIELQSLIKQLITIKEEAQEKISIINASPCPEELLSYVKVLARCAEIYDSTIVLDWPDTPMELLKGIETESPDMAKALRWFAEVKTFCDADSTKPDTAQEFLDRYEDLTWTPPFARWVSDVADLRSHLKADIEAAPLVREWRDDVRKGYREQYQSRIGKQKYGKDLTEAWIIYTNGNYQGAITKAMALIPIAASPVVDLASILLRICWVRLSYFSGQSRIDFDSSNPKLMQANQVLWSIVSSPLGVHALQKSEMAPLRLIFSALPLTDKDSGLFEMILDEGTPSPNLDTEDWLNYYYCLCLHHKGTHNETRTIARKLDMLRETIPPSPEKQSIMEYMEKFL